jgi:adenylate cyclase
MFTDLRGFTTFSEKLPAEKVIELLNMYLSEMSEAILAHGGTLISYMGDGILAVFGAPIEQPDHADRALDTAREMLDVRLPRFNELLASEGFESGFKMGIGLNTGPFMAGNVGSERRLEFTTIGDTTNTASRMEGMTKGTPHSLFLADSTRDALTRPVDDLVFVDELPVRGREAPIKLWSIAEEPKPAEEAMPAPEVVAAPATAA